MRHQVICFHFRYLPSVAMLDIYADESCQNRHRYMVLGGVCAATNDVPQILSAIQKVRDKHKIYGEFKWTKVSKAKLQAYIELTDVFFSLAERNLLHFHSITIDTTKLDHSKHSHGDSEIGFSKFIYQLLIKFGRLYESEKPYYCYLDKRTTNQSITEFKSILNNGIAKNWSIRDFPYKRVAYRSSKKSDMLQLNDVLLGAIASRTNCHHEKEGASKHRCALSEHIVNNAGIKNLLTDTPRSVYKFTIWNIWLK